MDQSMDIDTRVLAAIITGFCILVAGALPWVLSRIDKRRSRPATVTSVSSTDSQQSQGNEFKPVKLEQPHFFDDPKKGLTHEPDFLEWSSGTLSIWVDVTEDHLDAPCNRYIFSHTTNWRNESGYPDSLSLCACRQIRGWRLDVHREAGRCKPVFLHFDPGMFGWRLLALRWNLDSLAIEISVDCGRWKVAYELPSISDWPQAGAKPLFIGQYVSGFSGGEARTRLQGLRLVPRWVDDEWLRAVPRP